MNWHVWPSCNYACTFCFAQFANVRKALDIESGREVIRLLAEAGTEKVTFAGGEPTICPWLDVLILDAKRFGMTTMIVTNGTGVTPDFLSRVKDSLDWVALSVDSPDDGTEQILGRGRGEHVARARGVARLVRECGIRLKVNTVVTRANLADDMHDLIREFGPERWKVFQILPIAGENDAAMDALGISSEEFVAYLARHGDLSPVGEDNDAMTGSYLMLDPLGRFFQNTSGAYVLSRSVLDVGVESALREVGWDERKFVERGGLYSW